MWREQLQAWRAVLRARKRLLKAGTLFDQMMTAAKKTMEEKPDWEREDRELREEFFRECEQVRTKAAASEIAAVKAIRRKMADKLQEAAVRAPILRREMSRPRSNSPTPIGHLGKEFRLLQKRSESLKVPSETSSTKTPNCEPPTDQLES